VHEFARRVVLLLLLQALELPETTIITDLIDLDVYLVCTRCTGCRKYVYDDLKCQQHHEERLPMGSRAAMDWYTAVNDFAQTLARAYISPQVLHVCDFHHD
jgi:hypothetical protein